MKFHLKAALRQVLQKFVKSSALTHVIFVYLKEGDRVAEFIFPRLPLQNLPNTSPLLNPLSDFHSKSKLS